MIEKPLKSEIEKSKKEELTVDQCVKKAQGLIKKNGMCLFLFDVKGSKKYLNEDRRKLQWQLKDVITDMNIEFDEYFPKNNLATQIREEKGFYDLIGDGSLVGINSSDVISKMVEFIHQKLPNVSFRFNIARDGYDQKAMKTIK